MNAMEPESTRAPGDGEAGWRRRLFGAAFVGVLLAGLAFRLLSAWYMRCAHNPDFGTVALMAKHMAEGKDFPIFFYGQAYMGSLEPAVSAVLCRLFGFSGWVVCLGTALVAFLILPVVYLWARDIGGRAAGLAAMAYCAIGPGSYFHYMGSPRGGYAATLLLGVLVLWFGTEILYREHSKEKPVRAGHYFLLGVLAGLAWWTNQLITSATLAVALAFLLVLRQRVFHRRVWAGIPGFAIGSFPFWLWNMRNNWGTFAFSEALEGNSLKEGIGLFLFRRFPSLLDVKGVPDGWRWAVLVFFAAMGLALLFILIRGLRTQGGTRRHLQLLTLVLFVAVSAVLFGLSSFARLETPRYLLPLVPAMAVAVGTVLAAVSPRIPFGLAWLPLAGLIAWQALQIPFFHQMSVKYQAWYQSRPSFARYLREHQQRVIYTPYAHQSMNYMLGEEFCFAENRGERYAPYAETAEQADRVAVFENYGGVTAFVADTGGSLQEGGDGGSTIQYGFIPPVSAAREIPPDRWEGAVCRSGAGVYPALADRKVETTYGGIIGKEDWIEVSLKEETVVSKVRIFSPDFLYPDCWKIQGQRAAGDPWEDLTRVMDVTGYFWSGPRPFCGGRSYRLEGACRPLPVRRLRVWFLSGRSDKAIRLSEIQLFGPDGTTDTGVGAMTNLVRILNERGVLRVYSDRWEANQIHRHTGGRVATRREEVIVRQRTSDTPSEVTLDAHTAFLVGKENAAMCREVLLARGLKMREEAVGPWVLFSFEPGGCPPAMEERNGLYWTGFSCLRGYCKRYAFALGEQARGVKQDNTRTAEAAGLLKESVDNYPFVENLRLLSEWRREAGDEKESRAWVKQAERIEKPAVPARVRFGNGVELVGVEMPAHPVRPGETITLRYYWTCPTTFKPGRMYVFVHFKRGNKIVFQDDHILLENEEVFFQPYPEVFAEDSTEAVPLNAQAGPCEMHIGLYSGKRSLRREKAHTSLPVHHDAVRLPVTLDVAGSGGISVAPSGDLQPAPQASGH